MQRLPAFPPELEAALRKARDQSDGRWLIAVYTAGENGELHQHTQRGGKWSDEKNFLTAYRLFVGEFLRVTPEQLAGIVQQPVAAIPEPPVPVPEIKPEPVVKAAPKSTKRKG
jgi:hypothetical protein